MLNMQVMLLKQITSGKWMINDGDRHGYKTRSSACCILYRATSAVFVHLTGFLI